MSDRLEEATEEQFLRDLQALWEEHGKTALEATVRNNPEVIVSAMSGLLPKQVEVMPRGLAMDVTQKLFLNADRLQAYRSHS